MPCARAVATEPAVLRDVRVAEVAAVGPVDAARLAVRRVGRILQGAEQPRAVADGAARGAWSGFGLGLGSGLGFGFGSRLGLGLG